MRVAPAAPAMEERILRAIVRSIYCLQTNPADQHWSATAMTTPPERPSPSLGGAAVGAGLGCLVGAFIVPLAVFVVVLIAERFNPQCGTPADSGGCEMGLASSTIMAVVPGVPIGVVVGFALGQRGSRQKPKS
jgi:hypothetical protein